GGAAKCYPRRIFLHNPTPPADQTERDEPGADKRERRRLRHSRRWRRWWCEGAVRTAGQPVHTVALCQEKRSVGQIKADVITPTPSGGDRHHRVRNRIK